ncbi:MAG TPA: Ig-like domain repeat protein [Nocardioidaceae bacterium]
MLRSLITGRIFAALLVGGLLALAQLSGPATVTSAPAIESVDYPAGPVTTTEMWLDHPTVRAGEANSAHVKVTSNTGTPQGFVNFRVGRYSKRVPLVNGQADFAIPTNLEPGTYKVTARYNGKLYQSSGDTEYLTVTNGEVAGSSANRPGAAAADASGDLPADASGDLPATGSDGNSVLFGLIGLGLVGLGAFNLIGHRRRSHA